MNRLLLKLLGAGAHDATGVVNVEFEIHPALGWGVFSLLAAFAIIVAGVAYSRRDVELAPSSRRILLGLRAAALLAVAGVLLRPGLGLGVVGLVRQRLVLLLDESASLALRDPRTETADQVRAAIAQGRLPASGGLDQRPPPLDEPSPSRVDLLRASLTNRDMALIERLGRNFELKAMGFAGGLVPLGHDEEPGTTNTSPGRGLTGAMLAAGLRAEGRETAPGTAIREVLDREHGRPLGGLVLFTDGIRNAGPDPREAADRARESGVALHIVALGTTQPRDLQVVELSAPEVAFVRDEVPVNVRLRARGLVNETVRVTLDLNGQKVDERDVLLENDGETVVPMKFNPAEVGDLELAVNVPARKDEILAENNRDSHRLRVIDDRIRILLVEQSPRWEFRYLQALLLRDRRVELKCVLFDGDPAITRGPGSPYLDAFPTRREEIFGYDLIVLGDVDPRNFTPSQLEILADFISRGGGSFLMIAGRRYSPWSYRDSPLEKMLPVEFDRPTSPVPGTSLHDRPLKLALTPAGRASPLLRLAEDPEENQRRWEKLPPLFWVAPVRRAKPAAEVLLTDPSREDALGPIPVIALQQYGVGRSMFIGTDNTWRWRRNEGEQFFIAFWGRVVQRLAIHHLLSGSRRTQLALDRVRVIPGERVGVSARLFTSAFEPLAESTVRARVESDTNTDLTTPAMSELDLRAVPDQPGLFHGEFVAPAPGRYRLRVGEDAPAAVDFSVEKRVIEEGETSMQEGVLRELATRTGGAFLREEDLYRLPDAALNKAQRVQSRLSIDLWSSPFYYLLILGLLGCEWGLRKWWQLK